MVNERPETQTERPRKTKARRILRLIVIVIGASVAGGFLTTLIIGLLMYDTMDRSLIHLPSLAFFSIGFGLVSGLVPSLICAGLGYRSRHRYGVEIGAFIGGILGGPVVAYLFSLWLATFTMGGSL